MAYRSLFRVRTAALSGLTALSLMTACDNGRETPTGAQEIELQFDAKIGNQQVACGEPLSAVGQNKRAVELKDLRFYVHDVQLIDDKGEKVALQLPDDGAWQYRNVALLDFENKADACDNGTENINALVRGKVPAGRYTGLSFRIGVPSNLSHGDTGKYRAPLTYTALYWNWLSGFIHFKLDLVTAKTDTQELDAYEVHVGSKLCTNDGSKFSCDRENLAQVELPSFDPAKDKVVFDLGTLLEGVDVSRRAGVVGVPGCASGVDEPDCGPIMAALGLDHATGQPKPTASAFSVVPRDGSDPGRSPTPDAGIGMETEGGVSEAGAYELELPDSGGFQQPIIPPDNPLSAEKIELGRHLFYDKRLSLNETQSCASCHQQALAFTDGRPVGVGSTGQKHVRGAMSLANVAYATTQTWANPTLKTLEAQAHVPMFGTEPVELGFNGMEDELVRRLRAEPRYQTLFPAAFPDDADPFTVANVQRAIASFERTLLSGNSAYDRYQAGDKNAISAAARRGEELFFDPSPGQAAVECFHCHGGPTFSDQVSHANQPSGAEPFHNTGLYSLDFEGSYPEGNQGLYEFTHRKLDKGRFKTPTLRNIAVTAPYMHDGSIATLEEVIAHYARGGRNVESGPNVGDGAENPNKSIDFIHGFPSLPAEDRAALVEFLKALTDEEFLSNPKYSDPW
jgi:cytochrome c peroxidase